MAGMWIGDAAKELNMDVFDAIAVLASKGNYPANGLLDEDRLFILKRSRGDVSGIMRASAPPPVPAQAQPPQGPAPSTVTTPIPPPLPRGKSGAAHAAAAARQEKESSQITAPLELGVPPNRDKTEEATVIIPPLPT